jgi:predicted DNA binding protein
MYKALFHVDGDSAYERATDATDTTIELWCNDHCDLLRVRGTDTDSVLAEVRDTVGIRDRVAYGDEQILITEDWLKRHIDDNIEQYLAQHGCLHVPPLTYRSGTKQIKVLALNSETLSSFYETLSSAFTVRVEKKQSIKSVTPESPLMSAELLLPVLSARQRDVLQTAHSKGYYELPRETTTAEVAETLGIARRTAEEHLRLAERKLVDELVEYV